MAEMRNRWKSLLPVYGIWAVIGTLPLLVPVFGSPYAVDVNFRTCSLVMISVSWNLMAGAGLISLGHSAFWGLGGYAAILAANNFGLSIGLSLVPAILCGALLGAALAIVTGRLRGIYFAISTFAMSEALRVLAVMLPDLTGGSEGLYLHAELSPGVLTVNVVAGIGAVAAALVTWAIARTRYHYALRAMRNNESAASMLGIQPVRYRIVIMAISGAMASFAGGINVWYGGYIDPGAAFDLQTTIDAQIAPILGGIYTLPGPIIGAMAAVGLREITRSFLGDVVGASLLVFGVILVLSILYMPQGIYGVIRRVHWKSPLRSTKVAVSKEAP